MSGLRVVYAYHLEINLVEFIEIYYKGNQKNHDKKLIEKYLAQIFYTPTFQI